MVAIKNMEMPKNCIECNHMDLQQAINCQLIYSGCANCGRHPNCPLVEIEERKEEKWIPVVNVDNSSFDNVKERKGKWIEHNQTTVDGSRDYIECSCCKVWFGKWKMPRNSYCPNCGAEMRGNEE